MAAGTLQSLYPTAALGPEATGIQADKVRPHHRSPATQARSSALESFFQRVLENIPQSNQMYTQHRAATKHVLWSLHAGVRAQVPAGDTGFSIGTEDSPHVLHTGDPDAPPQYLLCPPRLELFPLLPARGQPSWGLCWAPSSQKGPRLLSPLS